MIKKLEICSARDLFIETNQSFLFTALTLKKKETLHITCSFVGFGTELHIISEVSSSANFADLLMRY